jgi:hypothetical protein
MYFVTNTAIVCRICGSAYASWTAPLRDRRLAPSACTFFVCFRRDFPDDIRNGQNIWHNYVKKLNVIILLDFLSTVYF